MPTVPLPIVHTIAYFTDALAPVWSLPLIEGQALKKRRVPANPELQAEIDRLVGRAVIITSHVRHVDIDGSWSLDADYLLNVEFNERIVSAIQRNKEQSRELTFVREVVLALAGLGLPGMRVAAEADATYSDSKVDIGGVINLDNNEALTKTTQVASRFAELLDGDTSLTDAEITHLYVRHLYSNLRGVR